MNIDLVKIRNKIKIIKNLFDKPKKLKNYRQNFQ